MMTALKESSYHSKITGDMGEVRICRLLSKRGTPLDNGGFAPLTAAIGHQPFPTRPEVGDGGSVRQLIELEDSIRIG